MSNKKRGTLAESLTLQGLYMRNLNKFPMQNNFFLKKKVAAGNRNFKLKQSDVTCENNKSLKNNYLRIDIGPPNLLLISCYQHTHDKDQNIFIGTHHSFSLSSFSQDAFLYAPYFFFRVCQHNGFIVLQSHRTIYDKIIFLLYIFFILIYIIELQFQCVKKNIQQKCNYVVYSIIKSYFYCIIFFCISVTKMCFVKKDIFEFFKCQWDNSNSQRTST